MSQTNLLYNPYALPQFPQKDPSDSLNYGADFTAQMAIDDDNLTAIVSVVANPSDMVINDLVIIGNVATFRASGGTLGTIYLIDVTVSTSLGNTFRRGFTMAVLPI